MRVQLGLEVGVGPRLKVARDRAASQLVKGLYLELFAVDEQFLQSLDVVLDIERLNGLEFDHGDVLLKLVVGGREHYGRHYLEVIELLAVIYDDVEEVGVDFEIKGGARRVQLQLFVDVHAHQSDLPRDAIDGRS